MMDCPFRLVIRDNFVDEGTKLIGRIKKWMTSEGLEKLMVCIGNTRINLRCLE